MDSLDRGLDLLLRRAALELRREFLDASCRIDEALLASVGGVRIHRDVARDNKVLHAVNLLFAGRFHGGLRQETLARPDIEEANVIESGMAFGFHSSKKGLISLGALCNAARLC